MHKRTVAIATAACLAATSVTGCSAFNQMHEYNDSPYADQGTGQPVKYHVHRQQGLPAVHHRGRRKQRHRSSDPAADVC